MLIALIALGISPQSSSGEEKTYYPTMEPYQIERGATGVVQPQPKGLSLLIFEISPIYLSGQRGNTFSWMASWSPSYWFSERFRAYLNVGAAPIKESIQSIFLLWEIKPECEYQFSDTLSADLGIGLQIWSGASEVPLSGTLGFAYWMDESALDLITKWFLKYSFANVGGTGTSQFRLGFAIHI